MPRAFDENGILRDGQRARFPMMMRDRETTRARHAVVVDGAGNVCSDDRGNLTPYASRPGARYLAPSAYTDGCASAREQAYAEVAQRQRDAWRDQPGDDPQTGFGSGEFTTMREGD